MKQILLASTSTLYGSGYLEYLRPTISDFFADYAEVLFIPFARPSGISHDAYTALAARFFDTINIKIKGLHRYKNPNKAIKNARAVFTGGGNTFLLVKQLYDLGLMEALKQSVVQGTKYLGTSAGSNIAGPTMQNTNDMPIIYPPSFETCGWMPFNINPHYLDPDPDSTHKGETRETRIMEYLHLNDIPVLGLREGSWLSISGDQVELCGQFPARFFEKGKKPVEIEPGLIN